MPLCKLFKMPMIHVHKTESTSSALKLYARVKSKRSKCPECGKYSDKVHDHYQRKITDLPVFHYKTILYLRTRKFKCLNSQCNRKVFSEQSPCIPKYSRRTQRLSKILDTLSIELSGNQGRVISQHLSVSVSQSTLTRIAHRQPLPQIKSPQVLGVDDWAYRKGVSYGTVLIDMETSKPIDLLESRDGKDLKKWLKKYGDAKIITRDRASSYSSAINEICPQAIQVADRFHLLMNLSDALDKYFKSIGPKIKTIIDCKTNEILGAEPKTINTITSTKKVVAASKPKFDPRLVVFEKVKELQIQGLPIKKIARDLKVSRGRVRSYFQLESLPPRIHNKSTNIELFTNHILQKLNVEGYRVIDIFKEIKALGYNGSQTQAYHNINLLKQEMGIITPDFNQCLAQKVPFVKPLRSRELGKYIGKDLNEIHDEQVRKYLITLLENSKDLRVVRKLVQLFKTMFKNGKGNIRRWISFVKRSKKKLTGLKSFANGLNMDIEAVENGITMNWSNGKVEGHVNRIKTIKRQMYGPCFPLCNTLKIFIYNSTEFGLVFIHLEEYRFCKF